MPSNATTPRKPSTRRRGRVQAKPDPRKVGAQTRLRRARTHTGTLPHETVADTVEQEILHDLRVRTEILHALCVRFDFDTYD